MYFINTLLQTLTNSHQIYGQGFEKERDFEVCSISGKSRAETSCFLFFKPTASAVNVRRKAEPFGKPNKRTTSCNNRSSTILFKDRRKFTPFLSKTVQRSLVILHVSLCCQRDWASLQMEVATSVQVFTNLSAIKFPTMSLFPGIHDKITFDTRDIGEGFLTFMDKNGN